MHCPACKSEKVVPAEPLTRKTKAGGTQVLSLRMRCEACGLVDRKPNFTGALSLNRVRTDDYDFREES